MRRGQVHAAAKDYLRRGVLSLRMPKGLSRRCFREEMDPMIQELGACKECVGEGREARAMRLRPWRNWCVEMTSEEEELRHMPENISVNGTPS